MKTLETRFVGNGNAWVGNGHYRGWQVTCGGCGVTKLIASHNGNSLPPNILVKKFTQAGWYLGRKADEDVCPGCRRKRSKKAEAAPAAPVAIEYRSAAEFWRQLRFCLTVAKEAAQNKQHNRAASYIETALKGLDLGETKEPPAASPPRQPKPEPPPRPEPLPPENDADYDQWLASLNRETHHDDGGAAPAEPQRDARSLDDHQGSQQSAASPC